MYSCVFTLLLTAAVAVALVHGQSGSCTSGSDYYTPIDIYNAISQAESGGGGWGNCSVTLRETHQASRDYPHQYDDYEATAS